MIPALPLGRPVIRYMNGRSGNSLRPCKLISVPEIAGAPINVNPSSNINGRLVRSKGTDPWLQQWGQQWEIICQTQMLTTCDAVPMQNPNSSSLMAIIAMVV
ncbi:uncharacterized protein N7477_006099 [Penicillium maclennaniae]|uniref:uncharacterized protein n=1 Tax=Penicillium maclennaniae TaxID=1343394 RepID=UPI002541DD3D|nr:uncharacterized protein N7477_006099 [Penicillium maclennaniae]KAJ5670736.1 hypothetical protein N7477_006099 [Penicillium maclennaniae]